MEPLVQLYILSAIKKILPPEEDDTSVNWESTSPAEITEVLRTCGLVGLGGAAFPTHVKLSPPPEKKIDTLILNGCECEPYLTADHRLMLECPEAVVLGARIFMKALGVTRAFIGIENNKPDAIQLMTKAAAQFPEITVVPLKTKYPQGAEKSLISAITRRTVPAGGLPMDVGVVVNNVATALASAEAVIKRKPLLERVVTVTGDGIKEPKNVVAWIGTPLKELISFCGGLTEDCYQLIMGGPMMGKAQYSLDVPIVKATSGILCLRQESVLKEVEHACIKCGKCVNVCPQHLVPTRLVSLTKNEKLEAADAGGILNCVECGSCAYVCPAHIPLVQWLKIGKYNVNEQKRKAAAKTKAA